MTPGFRRRAGFTIVELLVSVAVISVLLTLSAPALMGTRESARRVQCYSNLRTFGLAIQMYREDHDGVLPIQRRWYYLPAGHTQPIDELIGYMDGVQAPRLDDDGYIVSEAPFRCPSDPYHADATGMSYIYGPLSGSESDRSDHADSKDTMKIFDGIVDARVLSDFGAWHEMVEGDPRSQRNALKMSGAVGSSRERDSTFLRRR